MTFAFACLIVSSAQQESHVDITLMKKWHSRLCNIPGNYRLRKVTFGFVRWSISYTILPVSYTISFIDEGK